MPVHDWTRVDSGLFHAFHQHWIIRLCDALNGGGLPSDYYALPEQSIRGPVPDVLTLRLSSGKDQQSGKGSAVAVAVAVATAPPRARVVCTFERSVYAKKADRVTIRHRHGEIVAVIEIISPGNKASNTEFRAFVEKISNLIQQGVHILVIDLFPPTKRDPQGIHNAIWNEVADEDYSPPDDQPLTVAAYSAGAVQTAYVEPFGVRDELPTMPLFLEPELYVPVPLEETYRTTWSFYPAALKGLLEDTAAGEDLTTSG